MKTFVLFLLIPIVYSSVVPLDTKPHLVTADDNGQVFNVDINALPKEEALRDTARNSGNIYLLYTRLNPTSGQSLTLDSDSILASNFDPSLPTVVVCHGYTQSQNSELNRVIRDAYLGSGDFNVLILDWSYLSLGNYATAIVSVPTVGQDLGAMLLRIHEVTGSPLETMHVVGFSLGAHVAGNAGRYTGGRVGRVTGLDPVSPIWLLNSNRLASTDGIYVECIHTYGNNGGTAWGDADFYVNGGGSQPGCILSLCSHDRAWQIFAATVTYNHLIGSECSSQDDVVKASCTGSDLAMGNSDVTKNGSGLFYVAAGRSYPFL